MRSDRQCIGQLPFMQRKQDVDRGLVPLGDRRRRIAGDEPLFAEVFDDQKSLLEIGLVHGGRGEAVLPQPIRHRHERHDIIGEVRDRAIRLVAAHRRAVRAAWEIHQQHALIPKRKALVGAR